MQLERVDSESTCGTLGNSLITKVSSWESIRIDVELNRGTKCIEGISSIERLEEHTTKDDLL